MTLGDIKLPQTFWQEKHTDRRQGKGQARGLARLGSGYSKKNSGQ